MTKISKPQGYEDRNDDRKWTSVFGNKIQMVLAAVFRAAIKLSLYVIHLFFQWIKQVARRFKESAIRVWKMVPSRMKYQTKQLLLLLVYIVLLIAAGAGTAVISAFATMLVSNDKPFDDLSWITIKAVAIYFGVWLMLFHVLIGFYRFTGVKFRKRYVQAMEYVYLILAIGSISSITSSTADIAGMRLATREKYYLRPAIHWFDEEVEHGLEDCDARIPTRDGSGAVKEACEWFNEADSFGNGLISRRRWDRINKKRLPLVADWKAWRAGGDRDHRNNPLLIVTPKGETDIGVRLDFAGEEMDSYFKFIADAQIYKDYKVPEELQIARFVVYFVLAYALAIRISKLSAETVGVVGT
jgi:hypothetical protein